MPDGVREVGDAGEVGFRFENGVLTLVGTRANPGWEVDMDEQDAEEIEAVFGRDNTEWNFDVQAEGCVLPVEIVQAIAEAGVYRVGDAGEAKFGLQNDRMALIEALSNEGWDMCE